MSFSFNEHELTIGQGYTLVQLASLWGYANYHAIRKGVVTPHGEKLIFMFITQEKHETAVPYVDKLDGNLLYMQGPKQHTPDARIASNLPEKKDKIFLFYRSKAKDLFVYYGEVKLIDCELHTDKPSEFQFILSPQEGTLNDQSLMDVLLSAGTAPEGMRKVRQHLLYERNARNKMLAIRFHGHKCKICGFDYDEFYGKDIANSYIEVHHIKPLSDGEQQVDPLKDLIPVCANCHRMLHRKMNGNISIDELQRKIQA